MISIVERVFKKRTQVIIGPINKIYENKFIFDKIRPDQKYTKNLSQMIELIIDM